jgi:hypothetical protein
MCPPNENLSITSTHPGLELISAHHSVAGGQSPIFVIDLVIVLAS